MSVADYGPARVEVTFAGQPLANFGPSDRLTIDPSPQPIRIEFTLRADSESVDRLFELAGKPKPWPLLLRRRDRPKRRAHARGGLRRMVRQRRQFIVDESRLSGGVNQPLEVTLGCRRRPRQRGAV